MFKRLRSIYLQKWDDQFRAASGAESEALMRRTMVEWGEALADLSAEQIKRGIERCRAEREWPPSIAGFLKFAKSSADCWEHAGPAYQLHHRALPKPKADADVVRGNLAAMRGAFGRV